MNKKLTKLLSVFIIAGAIGTGSAVGLTGCKEEHKHEAAAEWTSDETNHWHNCTADDGERLDLGEHEYDNAADADCNVCGYERVVNIAVTGISLDKATATLKLGETTTVTLTATVTPSNATNKNVTWKTSNAEVATVANGVVTAVAQGTATITATTVDGAKTATCEITVQAASQTPENPDTPVNPPAKQEYTITFNANGHGTAPEAVTTVDGKATKPADLTDADYDFGGWYLTAECDGEPVDFTTKVFEANTTVYAKWTEKQTETPEPDPPVVNKYTVTWKNYDGTVLETDTEVVEGTIPTYDGATPVKEGDAQYSYTFKGWNKEVVAVTGDVEYIAEFEQSVNKYTVTWKNYDGTVLETDLEVPYGAIPTYDGNAPTRVEDGKNYSFSGWDKEVVAVTGDVEYVANFELLDEGQFAITYNINGHGSAIANGKTNEGKLVGEVPTLQAAGYTFGGWYLTAECDGEAVDFATKVFEANTTVYAKWTVVPYTITYTGADDISHENPTTYTVESEEITLADLTKDYYDFLGWYNGNEKVTKIATGSTGDITLTAKWQATEYTITYEGLEGATHENPATYTIESEEISIKDPSSRDGYSFKGWTIEVDGTPTAITKIAAGSHGNITITANWAQKVVLTIAGKDGKTINTYNYEKGERVTTEVINEKAAPAAGYEIYKIYSDFEKGEEYEVGTIEQDTTIVVTYKLTAAAIEEAIQETAKMQRVTVTTSMDGVSLTVFESDGTIVFDGISGSSETYRVYKQDNSYTEYFHANGSNDWYKREVTATEGETYATYVAKLVGEQVCEPASIIAMSETMAFDDKTDCYYIVQPASEETLKLPTRLGMFIKDGLVAGYEEVLYQGEVETRATITIEEKATAESVQLPDAKEYTKFIQLAGSENLIIYEDFSAGAEYGNLTSEKQYLALYADKSSEAEHFSVNENGQLTQTTSGANFGLTIPFGVPKGIVEGCFDISVSNNVGTKWKLIQLGKELIIGTKESKTEFEYSIDGGENYKSTGIAFNIDTAYTVHFTYNVETGEIVVNINGTQAVSATLAKAVDSIYVQSGSSGARKLTLDNIAVIAQQKTAAEYYETAIANFQKEFESKYILETVYEKDENGEIKNDAEGNPIVLNEATHSYNKEEVQKVYNERLDDIKKYAAEGELAEASAIELVNAISGYLEALKEIETDAQIDTARDAAKAWLSENYPATNYTITVEGFANQSDYQTLVENFNADVDSKISTSDIENLKTGLIANISNISTDEQTITTLKSTATTEITGYRAEEIEALQNADAKVNIANTKSEAITTLANISGETSDAIITAINAHVAEVKAALDKAIASADDTADKHKADYRTELEQYGQTYSSEGVDALVTAGCSAIDAVEDSAPATAAEAVLNEHKDIIYKAYATKLYNEYVEAENAKVHANDSSIDLETGAPEVPTFADCSGENAINEALESAKTAYTEFVNGVLAATEYTITFGEGETKTVKYGEAVSADGIADPTAGDFTKILKGWLKYGASYDFSTPVYGNFTLTANIVDAIKVTLANNAFSWAAIDVNKLNTADTEGKQDQAKPVMEGVNAFITPGDGLQYRTGTDTTKTGVVGGVVQGLKDKTAFSVTYESAGTLKLSIRGSGNKNATKITVVDVNGDVVGSYDLSGGSENYKDVTINIPKAGTYSVNVSTGVCRFASIVQTQEAYKVEKIHVSSVEVSGESRVELGASTTLTATINPDNASIKDVTWSIAEGSDYASIGQDGKLTAIAVGTVKVIATVDGAASEEFTVEVYINQVQSITISAPDGATIEEEKVVLTTGEIQLTATVASATEGVEPTIKKVTWSSNNEEVATVDQNGVVEYVGVGEATITATATDGSGVTATIVIKCSTVGVTEISSISVPEGTTMEEEKVVLTTGTIQLTAKVNDDATDQTINWSSSNAEVASVDQNGVVTYLGFEGTDDVEVTITATANDNSEISTTITIICRKVAVESVAFDEGLTETIKAGETTTLTAKALGASGATPTNTALTWSIVKVGSESLTEEELKEYVTVKVNENGSYTINGLKAGEYKVTVASAANEEIKAEMTVTVEVAYETVVLSCGENELASNATFEKTDSTLGVKVSSGTEKYRNRGFQKEIDGKKYYGWQSQTKSGNILTITTGSVKVKITIYFNGMSDKGEDKSASITFKVGENSKEVKSTGGIVSYTSEELGANSTLTLTSNSSNKPTIWAIVVEPVS